MHPKNISQEEIEDMRHERIKKNGHKHKIKMKVKDKINDITNKAIIKPNNQNLVNSKINSHTAKIEQL